MKDEKYLNREEQKQLQNLKTKLKASNSDKERKQIITKITLLREKAKIRSRYSK
ncbi:hypothetical protein [Alteribacillus sp. YIM 98480]|uniref:hypothetical protein n=1 Tax=Alteribacillus sp. YIM 98480 TaxID=2606599 RepID=UPI00131A611D|nr:hypothetical protein [Alteribacillus sp. YIM 98480]